MSASAWPDLPDWSDTRTTLHLWTQIVGKIRLAQTPWTNHSWHVPLYVTPRGLTTSPMPHGARLFEIAFDFVEHQLVIDTDTERRTLPLRAQSVAAFHDELMERLRQLALAVEIHGSPNEVEDPIPFAEDTVHASYDAEAVERFGAALRQSHRVFTAFRAQFTGKTSPVHFFWGSFDLCVTRFSGREAPDHPGGIPNLPDWITREAYSEEVSSVGFWPGDAATGPLFYSYAYPGPEGFAAAPVQPEAASFYEPLGEFVLPYEVVAEQGDKPLIAFAESTYEAAARLGDWDELVTPAPPEARPRPF
ncbi:MAG: DUF5996 family protein [Rubricoccaceae bacterium]